MAYKAASIPNTKVLFGESPLWDGRRNQLVFTDCFGKSVCMYDPVTSTLSSKVVDVDPQVPYIVVATPHSKDKDKFALTTGRNYNELVEFDWASGQVTRALLDLKASSSSPRMDFSDAKCDGKGRLWTGGGIFKDLATLDLQDGKGLLLPLQMQNSFCRICINYISRRIV